MGEAQERPAARVVNSSSCDLSRQRLPPPLRPEERRLPSTHQETTFARNKVKRFDKFELRQLRADVQSAIPAQAPSRTATPPIMLVLSIRATPRGRPQSFRLMRFVGSEVGTRYSIAQPQVLGAGYSACNTMRVLDAETGSRSERSKGLDAGRRGPARSSLILKKQNTHQGRCRGTSPSPRALPDLGL